MGYLREVHIAVQHHGIGLHRQFATHRTDIVLAIVSHHIVGSNESRHVAACFFWQIRIYFPEVFLSASTVNSLVNVGRTAVVCSNNEVPVSKNLIQVFQIVSCCIRRAYRVAALVNKSVYLQTIFFAGGWHKLPQSRCTYSWYSIRLQCRFNYWQIFQFQWQLIHFKSFLKQRHEEVACAKHETYSMTHAVGISVNECLYDLVVGHFHFSRKSLQAFFINFFAERRVGIRHLAVFIYRQICLCVKLVQQIVYIFLFHWFRKINLVIVGNVLRCHIAWVHKWVYGE